MDHTEPCTYKEGSLPVCSPLANAVVPMQGSSEPVYDKNEALVKGTLFPGLDLPFMNFVAKKPLERTPANELAALDFVSHELGLYLVTHPKDREAFAAWKQFEAMAGTARERYVELYGPVVIGDQRSDTCWRWNDDPWPWELREKEAD